MKTENYEKPHIIDCLCNLLIKRKATNKTHTHINVMLSYTSNTSR